MSKAFIVVGLGFGDEGKGTIVDYLTREYNAKLIVRFNGGPQAAHHVVTQENITHVFSQFGSGTFVPGVNTYISSRVVFDPLALIMENDTLKKKGVLNAAKRLFVNKYCLVVTPFHKIISRIREVSRNEKHCTCGKGVWETVKDGKSLKENALYFGDLFDKRVLTSKLKFIWHLKVDLAEQILTDKILSEIPNPIVPDTDVLFPYVDDLKGYDCEKLAEIYYEIVKTSGICVVDKYFDLDRHGFYGNQNIVFEGAQGILLDSEKGFFPYVTSGSTTFENAENLLLSSGFCGDIIKIGVLRPYFTRHGQGPFITEDSELTTLLPEIHNKENEWQGKMRIGWFDFVAAKYAMDVVGKIDCLAITNIDRLVALSEIKFCHFYEYEGIITDGSEFSKLFNWGIRDGRRIITGIKSNIEPELIQKEKLAEHLKKCKPNYRSYSFYDEGKETAIKNFIKYIESELKTPLGIMSYGPKATDKVCFIN